jgi:hypothetical protein
VSDRATLLALAERVEGLTGACRETDAKVALAVGYKTWPDGYGEGNEWESPTGERLKRVHGFGAQPPAFTASLDAAMTLVPEGWGGMEIYAPDADQDGYTVHISDEMRGSTAGFAKTLAAALTAAALRARAEVTP